MSTDAIEEFVQARMRADRVPGLSVAVVRGEQITWLRGFGTADLDTAAPARPETSYLWFSLTKIVTATAVMQLVDRGRLDLDAPAREYFPPLAVVRQPTPITLRHLLSHSSGLANPFPLRWVRPADAPAPDSHDFVERLLARHTRLRFAPGTRSSYSNLGFLVLGEVIALASGTAFEDHIRHSILGPIGMTHTGFTYPQLGRASAAVGYQPLPAPFLPLLRAVLPHGVVGHRYGPYAAYRPFYVNGSAYGGLIGGVDDLAILASAHLNEGSVNGVRLLSPAATKAMQKVTGRGGPRDFGLGWYRTHSADTSEAFVEHLGGGSGFWNVLRLYPQRRLGIMLMGNTTHYNYEAILAKIAEVGRA
ncbi:serine hydrolase domain-containing protein [Nocardia tengchongensis]|uniref:serine hydrolase domain-containing protein n=1 Tax=Nocardia tengchongensis TaxID=2055889 RepID=UPI0036A1B7A8